jgi:hypothetical protein
LTKNGYLFACGTIKGLEETRKLFHPVNELSTYIVHEVACGYEFILALGEPRNVEDEMELKPVKIETPVFKPKKTQLCLQNADTRSLYGFLSLSELQMAETNVAMLREELGEVFDNIPPGFQLIGINGAIQPASEKDLVLSEVIMRDEKDPGTAIIKLKYKDVSKPEVGKLDASGVHSPVITMTGDSEIKSKRDSSTSIPTSNPSHADLVKIFEPLVPSKTKEAQVSKTNFVLVKLDSTKATLGTVSINLSTSNLSSLRALIKECIEFKLPKDFRFLFKEACLSLKQEQTILVKDMIVDEECIWISPVDEILSKSKTCQSFIIHLESSPEPVGFVELEDDGTKHFGDLRDLILEELDREVLPEYWQFLWNGLPLSKKQEAKKLLSSLKETRIFIRVSTTINTKR